MTTAVTMRMVIEAAGEMRIDVGAKGHGPRCKLCSAGVSQALCELGLLTYNKIIISCSNEKLSS